MRSPSNVAPFIYGIRERLARLIGNITADSASACQPARQRVSAAMRRDPLRRRTTGCTVARTFENRTREQVGPTLRVPRGVYTPNAFPRGPGCSRRLAGMASLSSHKTPSASIVPTAGSRHGSKPTHKSPSRKDLSSAKGSRDGLKVVKTLREPSPLHVISIGARRMARLARYVVSREVPCALNSVLIKR